MASWPPHSDGHADCSQTQQAAALLARRLCLQGVNIMQFCKEYNAATQVRQAVRPCQPTGHVAQLRCGAAVAPLPGRHQSGVAAATPAAVLACTSCPPADRRQCTPARLALPLNCAGQGGHDHSCGDHRV